MLQRRQIGSEIGNQIDKEDLAYRKDAGTSFHSIAWIFISLNVTIYRTVPIERYQGSSSDRITTTKLRSCI
jgi:hypothetical protein